jgi:hypothetical protein
VPRPAVIRIASSSAWRSILSPVRREILESMQQLGPCPIADVATACGRPADGLYRHVRILVKAGFLVDAGVRKGKRNAERLFDAAADDFAAPRLQRGSSASERETVALTAEALTKSVARSMRASAVSGRLECAAGSRNFSIMHHLSWLTPRRFAEVHPEDAHPDHVAGTRIVEDARFDAKLTKTDMPGEPCHPKWLFHYWATHLRTVPQPSFLVDTSAFAARKREAVLAYRSQFVVNERNRGVPDWLDAAGRYFGSRIGAAAAEPFFAREPIGLTGLQSLVT